MPQPAPFESVFQLESRLGASWLHLHAAFEATVAEHERLARAVGETTREDTSIVVLGSAGRFEVTSGSDTDWTFLVDGQAQPEHRAAANRVAEGIEKKPGREGIFGKLAFSHDLIHYIGGQDDTNANLTRRILLLLESKPIGQRRAYDSVVRNVLERYLSGDHGWLSGRAQYSVPRFLHNDIARYWRTVTVDYAYKHWTRSGEEWALRSAKLRLSRKLTYAAGLLYAFALASVEEHPTGSTSSSRKQEAIEQLWQLTNRTPLDLLAIAFLKSGTLDDEARRCFNAYDEFIALLDDDASRKHLKQLAPENADDDERYQLVRKLGIDFQESLNALFLDSGDVPYPKLTRIYGVF